MSRPRSWGPRRLDRQEVRRACEVHMALVFDEYGHFEGIVTPGDILEAITGAFQEEEGDEPAFVTRDDGSFLVSGWMQADEFQDRIGGAGTAPSGWDRCGCCRR